MPPVPNPSDGSGSSAPAALRVSGRTIASPFAKKIASINGIDLRAVRGSGPGGRIVKADVERFRDTARSDRERAAARSVATPAIETLRSFRLNTWIDGQGVLDAVAALNRADESGIELSVVDFFVVACAWALRRTPGAAGIWNAGVGAGPNDIDLAVEVLLTGLFVTTTIRNADRIGLRSVRSRIQSATACENSGPWPLDPPGSARFRITAIDIEGVDELVTNDGENVRLSVGGLRRQRTPDGAGPKLMAALSSSLSHVDPQTAGAVLSAFQWAVEKPIRIIL